MSYSELVYADCPCLIVFLEHQVLQYMYMKFVLNVLNLIRLNNYDYILYNICYLIIQGWLVTVQGIRTLLTNLRNMFLWFYCCMFMYMYLVYESNIYVEYDIIIYHSSTLIMREDDETVLSSNAINNLVLQPDWWKSHFHLYLEFNIAH